MGRTAHTAFLLSILAAATGCDNVNWGGAELAVVPPPKVSGTPETSGEEIEERLPEGPLLYYIVNNAAGATMVPVGEIDGDSLLPLRARKDARAFAQRLIAEHMRQGSEFVLFRNGSRMEVFAEDDRHTASQSHERLSRAECACALPRRLKLVDEGAARESCAHPYKAPAYRSEHGCNQR